MSVNILAACNFRWITDQRKPQNRPFGETAIEREKLEECMAEGEGFEPPGPFRAQRFSRRVVALRLAPNPLISIDHIRQAPDGLGTQFRVLG
jgi:hypothetical protein